MSLWRLPVENKWTMNVSPVIKLSKTIGLLMTCFIVSFGTNLGQTSRDSVNASKIDRVVPRIVFPRMFVTVVGRGLYQENAQARYIFIQGGKRFEMTSYGGGREDDGSWGAIVEIPHALVPGACEIEVDINGRKSDRFPLYVSQTAKPPKLTKLSANIVKPGDFLWLMGTGFIRGQKLLLSDAEGNTFSDIISGVSSANSISFTVPKDFYSGIATLKLSGPEGLQSQSSNELKFEIRRGPIPVHFDAPYPKHLARGQWVGLNTNDSRPLYLATKIELRLIQGKKFVTSVISNFRRIHFQIPRSFRLGKMHMQSRTWIQDQVSEWSPTTDFEIVDEPTKTVVSSLEMLPGKAEAKLVQNGQVLKIVPIYFGVLPRVYLPEDTPIGNLEIYTRFWTENNYTEWKRVANFDRMDIENYEDHNAHPENKEKNFYTLNPFFDRLFFENSKPKFYEITPGNDLIVYGDFFVRSSKELRFLLEDGERKIYLQPSEHEYIGSALIHLPDQLPPGIWRIWLGERENRKMRRIPIKLKVN